MSDVVDFQKEAIGRLRAKVAELGGDNHVLLAAARGHRGAGAMVHAAVLAALDAEGLDHLIHVVTADWLDMLGLDSIVLALESGSQQIRATPGGIRMLAAQTLGDLFQTDQLVVTGAGHDVFGECQPLIGSHALVRLEARPPMPTGILALGSRDPAGFGPGFDTELLVFLGDVVSRCVARWLTPQP